MDGEPIELEPGAEWRRDPMGRHQYRLWHDGWTERVSDFGVRGTDPYTGSETTPTFGTVLGSSPARTRPHRRASTSTPAKTIGGLVALVGALLAGIGTLVPVFDDISRYTVNYFDLPGYENHGLWVALLAVAIAFTALVVLRPSSSRMPAVGALLLGTTMLVVVLRDWRDVDDTLTKLRVSGLGLVSGLTLCLIGAALTVLGSVAAIAGQRRL